VSEINGLGSGKMTQTFAVSPKTGNCGSLS
jgi:hypothetical protein